MMNGYKLAEKGLQPVQGHHVWSIAKGVLGIGMHLQEQTVYTNSHRSPSQGRHEFPLAAGAAALTAVALHQLQSCCGQFTGVDCDRIWSGDVGCSDLCPLVGTMVLQGAAQVAVGDQAGQARGASDA